MKKLSSLFLLLLASSLSYGQVVLENNPPSLSWYHIRTPHFNVIYPKGFDDPAQRVANTLEHLYIPETQTLSSPPKRISFILQNLSSISNAFVSVTPRRSEFYAMPPQDYNFIGANDWLEMLVSHEYRHVVQYQHATQGFNRLMLYLFGWNTLSALANLAVPDWFWEGDAVATETVFTPTGRGSIPYFGLVFKTNLLEGREFNYHKQYLRSYKHNIPNHYVLGYHMVSYLRRRTGDPMIWSKITQRAWRNSIVPFTFSNAIKKETGLYVTDLYDEMADDLKREWQDNIDSLEITDFQRVNSRGTIAYTDYMYPQPLSDGSIVVMKSGIGEIAQLIKLKDGKEEKYFVPGPVNETGMLSAGGGKVVWNEYRFHPRWLVKNYSVVMEYDIEKDKASVLGSEKARYGGASVSPDGKRTVTIKTDTSYQHGIVVLNEEGSVIRQYPNPQNYFYSMASWSHDGQYIVALKTKPEGKTVSLIHFDSGVEEELFPPADENIGYPVLYGDYLLYNSFSNNIDNIFAYHLQTTEHYQVTVSRYGAYNPAVSQDGRWLYYNDQSKNGMDVVRVEFDPSTWTPYNKDGRQVLQPLHATLLHQEEGEDLLDSIPQKHYPVRKYSRFRGLINPYSWGAYIDNSLAQADIGITSRDLLGTTAINIGYQYDINERTGQWHAGLSYQAWFPIINFDVYRGSREEETGVGQRDVEFNWNETGFAGGIEIPLLLTSSKYHSRMDIANSIGYTATSSFGNRVTEDGEVVFEGQDRFVPYNDSLSYVFNHIASTGDLLYNSFAISYSRSLKQSRRDFNPRWAQFLAFEHISTPYGGDYAGRLWVVRGSLFFPGLFKHHNLFFRGGIQSSLTSVELNTYSFRNRIFKPRGYAYPRDTEFYTLSANYALPLWYTDIAIGPVLNIQRVKANLFYDYGRGEGTSYFYNFGNGDIYFNDYSRVYQSAGAELTFDFNLFRILLPLEVGVRSSYLIGGEGTGGGWVHEVLIGNIPF